MHDDDALKMLVERKTLAHSLLDLIVTYRSHGNTSAMIQGVFDEPSIILAADEQHAHMLARQVSGQAAGAGVTEERLDGPEQLRPMIVNISSKWARVLSGLRRPAVIDLHTIGAALVSIVDIAMMNAAELLSHRADARHLDHLLLTRLGIRARADRGSIAWGISTDVAARPMQQIEKALDELKALRQAHHENCDTLRAWGKWAHAEQGTYEESNALDTALAAMPPWAFPTPPEEDNADENPS